MSKLNIYTDGGSRGNPGPAACAYVIQNDDGQILYKDSKFLGEVTNNVAEYQGLKAAVSYLTSHQDLYKTYSVYSFHLDSELVVRQMLGQYKVKDQTLLGFHLEVKKLLQELTTPFEFVHVPRSSNQNADKLLNLELDIQKTKI